MKTSRKDAKAQRERPILFSGAMVRALREKRKTQTRRVITPAPLYFPETKTGKLITAACLIWSRSKKEIAEGHGWNILVNIGVFAACPHGRAGDRLWVKETHIPKASGTIYRADFDEVEATGLGAMYGGWKPSIFMRRKFSRITLEISNVRVERLQEISEEDAIAEGIERDAMCGPVSAYQQLWESINGKGSWAKNPWVWIVEFKDISEKAVAA